MSVDSAAMTTATATAAAEPAAPWLSIVACSRNDGHGDNLLERMQLFIDGIADQAARFGLDCELVLVDWNPPADKPGLAEALRYPGGGGHLCCRVVTVPPELHARLSCGESLPLFQMIAKNVGIRRARGRMVLSTNIDILFPDTLWEWLARGAVDEDALYRADRADVRVPFGSDACADLQRMRAITPLRVNRRDGIYDAAGHRIVPVYTGPADVARYQLTRVLRRGAAREVRPARPGTVQRSALERGAGAVRKVWRLATLRKPHLNGCGDFTMLSKENWLRVGGHAEWAMYSWNLDALLLFQARAHGIREVDLGDAFTVLHMDHSKGSGWSPEGAADLFERMAQRGVPVLTDEMLMAEVRRLGLGVGRRPRPKRYNDEGWGYAELPLRERTI